MGQLVEKVMMPISALGAFRKAYGFTLLELMVVMIVIGISLSLVIPNLMKNDDDVLTEESMRLIALMEYAADSASTRGIWIAWSPTVLGYRFLQFDNDKNIWQPLINDDVLRERELAEGVQLKASMQQQTTVAPDALIPLSPSGVHAPFQMVLSIGEKKRVIQGNLLGKVITLPIDLSLTPI